MTSHYKFASRASSIVFFNRSCSQELSNCMSPSELSLCSAWLSCNVPPSFIAELNIIPLLITELNIMQLPALCISQPVYGRKCHVKSALIRLIYFPLEECAFFNFFYFFTNFCRLKFFLFPDFSIFYNYVKFPFPTKYRLCYFSKDCIEWLVTVNYELFFFSFKTR